MIEAFHSRPELGRLCFSHCVIKQLSLNTRHVGHDLSMRSVIVAPWGGTKQCGAPSIDGSQLRSAASHCI